MRLNVIILFLLLSLKAFCQPPAYVPTLGLVGFWPFTGNAADVSGNGNNGVVTGASLSTDRFSASNSAYSFNGTTNYISVPSNSTLSGYTDMSISVWINPGAFSGIQGIVTKWYQVLNCNNNANSDTYEAALSSNQAQFATNNNNLTAFTSPPTLPSGSLNNWVHLVYLSNSAVGQFIYINGVLSASFATTGAICSSANTLYFGTDYHGTLGNFHRFFNGKIDDIGIWNRLLTNCEIQQLYTSSIGQLNTAGSATAVCLGSQAALQASGASNYTWVPGNLTGSMVLVSPSVTTNYTVLATNTLGCAESNTLTLIVNPVPTVTITPSPPLFCAGEQVTLTASGASSYSWTGIGTGTSIVITALSPVSSYTLVGITGPCAVTSYVFYSVPNSPTVTVSALNQVICQGSSATLTANGGSSYTWQPGNFTGQTVTVSPSSNTTFTVTGSGAGGCFDSDTVTVFVAPSSGINVSANPTIVCPGGSSTLTVSGANSYTWFPGNLNGPQIAVNPMSTTIYTVTGNNNGCLHSATVTVEVGINVFITSSGNFCTGATVNLAASPAISGYTYLWSGPGIIGSPTSASINISTGGNYAVVVTNTFNNCSGSATVTIANASTVIPVAIVPSSTFACFPGPPVNLLVSASASLTWLPASEVTPSFGPLVSVSPTVTSSYTVLATLGACSGSAVVTISVNTTPTVTAASSSPTLCSGRTVTLTGIDATNYSWFPGNLSGSVVEVSPGFATVYTLTGSNGNCSSTATVLVEVFPSPLITTTAAPSTICFGNTSTLTAAGAPLIAWLVGDPPPLSYTSVVSPSTSTTYSVIGTNSLGCSSTVTVAINVIENFSMTAESSKTLICAGESVTLTAGGGSTYTWIPGFEQSSSIVITPTTSVIYTVVSGNSLCSRATVTITVDYCVNTSLGITNAAELPNQEGSDAYRIRFTVTANNSSQAELLDVSLLSDLEKTFPYPISYTVVNTPTLRSQNSLLTVNNLFNGNTDVSLTLPSDSRLPALKRDTLVYTVLIKPNGFAGELSNSVIGFATDQNNVLASDSSNNGFALDPDNDGNPTNNNVITLIEIKSVDLFIPEGFSPNGDNNNDFFVIKGLNGKRADLTVYNRWGNKVYEKNNYDNSWDGALEGEGLVWGNGKVPEGTYYYVLNFNTKTEETRTGFIVVRY